jgi:hypothetical protein
MNSNAVDALTRHAGALSRRSLLNSGLALSAAWLGAPAMDAKKKRKNKRKKKHHKGHGPTCGKAGDQPVKGTCCAGSVAVSGVCQACDVCARGCEFTTVQAAIQSATPGVTIAICPGTYREDISINRIVTLVGAGDGTGAGATIIQGTGENSVVTIGDEFVTLERLRFTGGGGNPDDSAGGGIHNGGTTKLIGCTVSGNATKYGGGGIFHRSGVLTLTDCVISGNQAGAEGGGIYVRSPPAATLEMIGCTVSGNEAAEVGGGIFNRGTLRLTESEISGNEAKLGGGLFTNGSDARATLDAQSRITGNTASDTGGGIYNAGGMVTLASGANVSGNMPTNCAGTTVALCP